MSPLLFIIVMEVPNRMFCWVRDLEMFKELKVRDVEHVEEVSDLFLANDTLLFVNQVKNFYSTLAVFS